MRRLAAALLVFAATTAAPAQQQTFVAQNGTFQIELPPGWRTLSPGEARTIGSLPGAPMQLGFVQPRLFYAVGPVDEWLQGRFEQPWLWVVEQDNEWVVEDDFAERLSEMWRENGAARGMQHELTATGREAVGPQQHAVLTAVRRTIQPEGPPLRSLDVYAPTGGRQVSLSLTCRDDQFDRWQPEFRSWLQTVRFARPAQGQPELSDRLWTPLAAGAVVTILLLLLYKHTHRQQR